MADKVWLVMTCHTDGGEYWDKVKNICLDKSLAEMIAADYGETEWDWAYVVEMEISTLERYIENN